MTTIPQTHPNVIVFFTDQQRWDCSGLHGNPLDIMPNFDRLARRGTHLFHSYTCQPVCGPARSSLQTGQYATTTGCWRNGIPLPPEAKTLAHHFKAGGYDTGYIGKWHLAETDPVPQDQRGGYDFWLAANTLEMTSEPYHCLVYDNDNRPIELPGYRVDALTDAAIRYVSQPRTAPFYLFLSFLEPHHQNHLDAYVAPDGCRERYEGRWTPPDLAALPGNPPDLHRVAGGSAGQHLGSYWGCVKRLDEALGRLMDALRSTGLADQTIVLFTSDHGCHFKTRNDEYKRSCHDASIRVPTGFWGPGLQGRHVEQLVSLVDLPPTLLDAAGLPIPPEMQGRSLLPLLHAVDAAWPEEVFIQVSESQVGRAVRTRRWKYGVVAPGKSGWETGFSELYREEFLYDMEYDPYEFVNLIGLNSHRDVADVLKSRLLRRMHEAGEVIPAIEDAPSRPGGQRRVTEAEAIA
ncbi:MAG: sulfatase-like hydrolase/transferase [Armatimonadota bacterium]|nr:sulfatase-like hydrolase/transferase [Armatimonadota bacterium]